MIYDEYLTQSELHRWILEADVAWNRVDCALAHTQPELLEELRDSALIESYFPLYTTKLVRALWDQVDATAVFSIQLPNCNAAASCGCLVTAGSPSLAGHWLCGIGLMNNSRGWPARPGQRHINFRL